MISSEVITIVASFIIVAVLTGLVVTSTNKLKIALDTTIDNLRASPNWDAILSMAQAAVRFAEQMKLTGKVADVGEEVKAEAIKALQAFLATQGWGSAIDLVAIDALVEGAYNELKAEFKRKVPELEWAATPLKEFSFTPVNTTRAVD